MITGKSLFFLFSWQPLLGNKFFHHNHAANQPKLLYPWKIGVKQLKTTEKNCGKGVFSTPFLRTQTLTMGSKCSKKIVFWIFTIICHIPRAFFNHLLRAVPARRALFEKWNPFFPTKNSKKTCRLGGCSVLNSLNLRKCGVKIHNCALLLPFTALFWLYRTHALIFPYFHIPEWIWFV